MAVGLQVVEHRPDEARIMESAVTQLPREGIECMARAIFVGRDEDAQHLARLQLANEIDVVGPFACLERLDTAAKFTECLVAFPPGYVVKRIVHNRRHKITSIL